MTSRSTDRACLVPGCAQPARNNLAVRCGGADETVFAVEGAGSLCDLHALGGGRMCLSFVADGSQQARLVVACEGSLAEVRAEPIAQPLDEAA